MNENDVICKLHLTKLNKKIKTSYFFPSVWFLTISKMSPNDKLDFNCYASEYEAFTKHMIKFQAILFKCDKCHKELKAPIKSLRLVKDDEAHVYINLQECENFQFFSKGTFVSQPFCLFIDIFEQKNNITNIDEIPLKVTLYGAEYHFLCTTIFVNQCHFKAVFRLNGQLITIDDLKKVLNKTIPKKIEFGTVFYYLR